MEDIRSKWAMPGGMSNKEVKEEPKEELDKPGLMSAESVIMDISAATLEPVYYADTRIVGDNIQSAFTTDTIIYRGDPLMEGYRDAIELCKIKMEDVHYIIVRSGRIDIILTPEGKERQLAKNDLKKEDKSIKETARDRRRKRREEDRLKKEKEQLPDTQSDPELGPPENSIAWWYEKLPKEMMDRAIWNIQNHPFDERSYSLDNIVKSLADAIDRFDWEKTDEGYEFWDTVQSVSLDLDEEGIIKLNNILIAKGQEKDESSYVIGTIGWYLSYLPYPYCEQAIQNTDPQILDTIKDSLHDALYGAFLFDETSQEDKYWRDLGKSEAFKRVAEFTSNLIAQEEHKISEEIKEPFKPKKIPEEWLQHLPEPYRSLALKDIKEYPETDPEMLEYVIKQARTDPYSAAINAISWDSGPRADKWENINSWMLEHSKCPTCQTKLGEGYEWIEPNKLFCQNCYNFVIISDPPKI